MNEKQNGTMEKCKVKNADKMELTGRTNKPNRITTWERSNNPPAEPWNRGNSVSVIKEMEKEAGVERKLVAWLLLLFEAAEIRGKAE